MGRDHDPAQVRGAPDAPRRKGPLAESDDRVRREAEESCAREARARCGGGGGEAEACAVGCACWPSATHCCRAGCEGSGSRPSLRFECGGASGADCGIEFSRTDHASCELSCTHSGFQLTRTHHASCEFSGTDHVIKFTRSHHVIKFSCTHHASDKLTHTHHALQLACGNPAVPRPERR